MECKPPGLLPPRGVDYSLHEGRWSGEDVMKFLPLDDALAEIAARLEPAEFDQCAERLNDMAVSRGMLCASFPPRKPGAEVVEWSDGSRSERPGDFAESEPEGRGVVREVASGANGGESRPQGWSRNLRLAAHRHAKELRKAAVAKAKARARRFRPRK